VAAIAAVGNFTSGSPCSAAAAHRLLLLPLLLLLLLRVPLTSGGACNVAGLLWPSARRLCIGLHK
jgi:hypothetical protein